MFDQTQEQIQSLLLLQMILDKVRSLDQKLEVWN